MERYVRWFAGLGRFYQILLSVATVVGLLAIAASAATEQPLFFAIGLLWILGGSLAVYVADRNEQSADEY